MAKCNEMTSGATMPLIFKFTMPLLLGNLLQQTYSLIDAAIVGKFLGISPLAAVGASSSVIFLILGFCNGCCCGFGIPVAQKFGARDYESMRRYVYSSLKLTAWLSVSIAVVTSLLCAAILRWMSTPENIFSDAYWYLLITFIGVPATFYYNLLSSIIRALATAKPRSGFCFSPPSSTSCSTFSASSPSDGEWLEPPLPRCSHRRCRLCCATSI